MLRVLEVYGLGSGGLGLSFGYLYYYMGSHRVHRVWGLRGSASIDAESQ